MYEVVSMASSQILAVSQSEQSGTFWFPFIHHVRHQGGWARGHENHCLLANKREEGEWGDMTTVCSLCSLQNYF
jgi:hypothetical protein